MSRKTTLLLLITLMALGLAACGSDSSSDSDDPTGVLSVYAEGEESTPGFAVDVEPPPPEPEMGGLRELHVTFTLLKLRKTDGSSVTLIDDASGSGTIDLVEAWNGTDVTDQAPASFFGPADTYLTDEGIASVVEAIVETGYAPIAP